MAEVTGLIKTLGKAAAKAVRKDKLEWIDQRTTKIVRDLRSGDTSSMWALAAQLGGRSKKRPAGGVMQGADGKPIATDEAQAAAWEAKFLEEFGGRGDMLSEEKLTEELERYEAERTVPCAMEAPREVELQALLGDAVAAGQEGKAVGEDQVPIEFWKAAGEPFLPHLARLGRKALQTCIPRAWRSGRMAPVPKKPTALTLSNSRGCCCRTTWGRQ